MSKKKITVLCIIAVVLVSLFTTLIVVDIRRKNEAERQRIYNETYLVMDGVEYRRDTTALDLSGKQIEELHKVQELTALQQLDLRDTGITVETYDAIQNALPDCEILWSVPFQGAFYDNTTQELTLEKLQEADLNVLAYFPELTSVNADGCTDYGPILTMQAQYPELEISYRVSILGESYPHTTEELTVTDPNLEELSQALPLLPMLRTVYLQGVLPENSEIVALKEQLPNVQLSWDFELLGVPVNSLDTFVDLSNITMNNTKALEAMLPCFYNLEQVDMVKCGISNEDMEALNQRHPKTKFVWRVYVSGVWLRTDIKYFMPWQYKLKSLRDLSALKYCHDMECIDLGHFYVNSTYEFVEHMPRLRFLLLLQCYVQDLSSITACTSLEYMELAETSLRDYWLLTNLTNLTDLNISATPFDLKRERTAALADITPLYQMVWLDRLWFVKNLMNDEQRESLRTGLPETQVTVAIGGCTESGWRHSPNYYRQRDTVGMWYMTN